jgi:hypothetical protein
MLYMASVISLPKSSFEEYRVLLCTLFPTHLNSASTHFSCLLGLVRYIVFTLSSMYRMHVLIVLGTLFMPLSFGSAD